jgi:hypothetical protein
MASFTDSITQFNPYVSQLPVDAMVKVGMQKQAQYDQGVQKIQSQIDNVAGIDVYRPVDKTYLQSKLNQLGSKLTAVAAGDFSNQQLVNTVGGMATQVVKDRQIQNAVASTANIKKQDLLMEKEAAKGEGLENQDLYNDQKMKYLSSTEADGSFVNGRYVPYINVNKKLKDIADMVGIKGNILQQLFKTDTQGNPLPEYVKNPKTGKLEQRGYQWNDIATTESFKGKDAANLLSAFKSALTPADYQQLAITGRYMYKNYDATQIADLATNEYSDQISILDRKIDEQKLYLINAENAANPNTDDITAHSQMYELLNQQKDAILKNKTTIQDSILKGDLDAAKGSVYADRYLTDMSARMASVETSRKSEVSPLFEINDKNRNFALRVQEQKDDNYWKRLNYNLSASRFELEKDKNELDKMAFMMKYGLDPKTLQPVNNVLPSELNMEDENIVNRVNTQVENKYESYVDATNQAAMTLAKEYFKALPGNKDLTESQLNLKLANTLKKYNTPLVPGEENKILNNFALKGLALYKKNKDKVPFENQGAYETFDKLLQETTSMRTGLEAIDKKAKEMAKEQGIDINNIADISRSAKGFNMRILEGSEAFGDKPYLNEVVSLSKEDAMNLAKVRSSDNSLFTSDAEKLQVDTAYKKLVSKFGERKAGLIVKQSRSYNTPVNDLIDKLNEGQNKKFAKIKAQLYKDNSFIDQSQRVPIFVDDDNKEAVGNKLSTVLNQYKNIIPGGEDVVNKLMDDITGNKFKADVHVMPTGNFGETVYELEVNGVTIPISASDYPFLTNQKAPKVNTIPSFITMLDINGTSNMTGSNNKESGNLFNSSKFLNYKDPRYTLTGDYVLDKDNKDLYWLKLYKHDSYGKEDTKVISYDQPIPKYVNEHFNSVLNTIPLGFTTDIIKQIESKSK